MLNRYVMVIDAGTSAARCHLFNGSANIIGSSTVEWRYVVGKNEPPFARSFNSTVLWETFRDLIVDRLTDAQIQSKEVCAIAITSQRQSVVFLDAIGGEVYAGPNLDLRAVFEGAAIDQEMAAEVYCTTGHLPSMLFASAKLQWFQIHRPKSYAKIAYVVTLADWLIWRLTGVLASEVTLAGEAGLLDIQRRDWCTDLLTDLDLTSNTIPLIDPGTEVGSIVGNASQDTGLAVGTPVIAGGADSQMGLLGLGMTSEHQVGIVAGWSAPLQMITSRPVMSQEAGTWVGCSALNDKWTLESNPGDIGTAYQWLADALFGKGERSFRKMDDLASTVAAGSEETLAFLGPSRMDMTHLGMQMGGFLFPTPLTFSSPGKGHLVKAAIEATAYSIKENLEQLEKVAGIQAIDISLGGGFTRTRTFVEVLIDVLNREVRVSPTPQVSALGTYLCALKAIGEFGDLEEAVLSVKPLSKARTPDPLRSSVYHDHYKRWGALSATLKKITL